CNGSIRHVHSDCLIHWLTFSKRDACDLCSHTFLFRQVYAHGCPDVIPFHEVALSSIWLVSRRTSEYLRLVAILMLWVVVTPYCLNWFYRLRSPSLAVIRFMDRIQHMDTVVDDIFHGLVLMVTVVLSAFYLVCIAEDIQLESNRFHRDDLIASGWHIDEHEPEGESDDEGDDHDDHIGLAAPPGPPLRRIPLREADHMPADAVPPARNPPPEPPVLHHHHHHPHDHAADDADWLWDVMGFQAHSTVALRNVLFFLVTSSAFLVLFVNVPHTFGSLYLSATAATTLGGGIFPSSVLPHAIRTIMDAAKEAARTRGDCLQLVDFIQCWTSYVVWGSGLFLWRYLRAWIPKRRDPHIGSVFGPLMWALSCLCAAAKLTTHLVLKVFVLPVVIGIAVDVATLPLFHATAMHRLSFAVHHMLAAYAAHWVLGMSFIHFISVAVLQLREVLHPDILTGVLYPHDPHQYKFKAILAGNAPTQYLSMAVATFKYAMFVPILVSAPVYLATWLLPAWVFPLDVHLSYLFAIGQVPLELAIAHINVQDSLDHFAPTIGHLQTKWMAVVCRWLGLVEFLLPRVPALVPGDRDVILTLPDLVFDPLDDPHHPQQRGEQPAPYGFRRREWPKAGALDTARMEYALLPRTSPSFVLARLVLLCLLWWGCMVAALVAVTLGPLVVGRRATALVDRFLGGGHDPVSLAMGVVVLFMWMYAAEVCRVLMLPQQHVHPALRQAGYGVHGLTILGLIKVAAVYLVGLPYLIGAIVSLLLPTSTWPSFFELTCFGFVVLQYGLYWACCLIPWDQGSVLDSLCVAMNQIQFHVIASDEGVVVEGDDVAHKCLDFAAFEANVVWPLARVLVAGLALPLACSVVYQLWFQGVLHLTHVHVFRAAFLTQVVGLLVVGLQSEAAGRWFQGLRDAIRDELYLVGRELRDYDPTKQQRAK
ncbi:hypothetical protein DYB38_006621, partial [Aphanomyces astaci]